MHELAVTRNVLDIALRHAPPGQRICKITLVVGQLSSMVDNSVQFYWDIISEDTAAVGAELIFRRIPARLRCQGCGEIFALNASDFSCPACGNAAVQVISGEEFYVESIEVEEQDHAYSGS